MKTIGIKLADGSFFPVMEDSHPAQKALELTTAHNNQTKVMVDLYRSKSCSMDDAEYVDSLQIDNLVSHPNGEPSIAFSVSLDENNQLSANIRDPETGNQSETAIPLITRPEEDLLVPDEYDISNIDDDDKAEPQKTEKESEDTAPKEKRGLLSAADNMMENKKKTDLDEPIFGDDALPDFSKDNNIADISNDDMFSTDDFLNFDKDNNTEAISSENSNDDKENIDDDFFDTEIPDFTSEEDEESQPEETAIFDDQALADFSNEPEVNDDIDNITESEPLPNFEQPEINESSDEEYEEENISDFNEPDIVELPDNKTEVNDDIDNITESEPLPNFEQPEINESSDEEHEKENISDFNEPDIVELPDNKTEVNDDIDNITESEPLPDFDNIDFSSPDKNNEDLDEFPNFDEPKSLTTEPDFDNLNTETPAISDENFFDMDDIDTFKNTDNNFQEESFDLPDNFNKDAEEEYYGSDLDQFPKTTSPIDDFSLPDFPEDNSAPELPDNFFDDFDDLDNSSKSNNYSYSNNSSSGAGPLSFTGLYDKETEMGMSGMQSDEITKKTKGPVIICVICALICIIATAFIFFAKPKIEAAKKANISKESSTEIVLNQNKQPENNQIKVVEEKSEPLPPPVPEAKEDEIIIIEQAEKVIPKQPEVIQEKLNDISYKVIWGDTLWDIANTYYKNPWKYTDIAKYNNIKNPDHIISGTTLIIPAE